jgi:SNW domain-containing protein 1
MSLIRQDVSEYNLARPSSEETLENILKTKLQLEESIQGKISVSRVGSDVFSKQVDSKFFQYKDKVVQIVEQVQDPLLPAKFRQRRVPRGQVDEPTPIERSPPRKLTTKDQLDWKIPPCISNWKNSRGYTIPLEMRLSADGRHLHDTTYSDKFPKLAEAIYQAEARAREEIKAREELQRKLQMKEGHNYEKKMQEIAAEARRQRAEIVKLEKKNQRSRSPGERDKEKERETIRYNRGKEIDREVRLEAAKKKGSRNRTDEREISEKIALGQARPTVSHDVDQRLFNQTQGVDGGFGSDDEYNHYDRPLFAERSAANIYRNVRELAEDSLPDLRTKKPVQFEKVENF